jgi:phage tail-like protein
MLNSLPAIYRVSDTGGQLQHLFGALEEVLFSSEASYSPGIEQQIKTISSFFSPLGDHPGQDDVAQAPDRFLPWLATWVAFTPHALFAPRQLRKIISGITPLYGRRGTRAYLKELLRLCFEEILDVKIDDERGQRFVLGLARIGEDTLFGDERPFWFRVTLNINQENSGTKIIESRHEFEKRIRAIIDFAKPGHTAYELHLHFSSVNESR